MRKRVTDEVLEPLTSYLKPFPDVKVFIIELIEGALNILATRYFKIQRRNSLSPSPQLLLMVQYWCLLTFASEQSTQFRSFKIKTTRNFIL